MGNLFCKSSSYSNTASPRNPLEQLTVSCPNLCPFRRNKQTYWKKHVINHNPRYLGPVDTNKWHNACTLASTQPLTINQKIIREQLAPIPPPRKKRTLAQTTAAIETSPKDGFQEIFVSGDFNKSKDALSDEPPPEYSSPKEVQQDPLDNFLEANAIYQTRHENLDRKAAFLMTMLNECDSPRASTGSSPKKPERSFDVFQGHKTPSPPIRRKRSSQTIKVEIYSNEPENNLLNTSDSIRTHRAKTMEIQIDRSSLPPKPAAKELKKSLSTQSFLSHEIMDELLKKTFGFEPFVIEEMGLNCANDDGSAMVTKNINKLSPKKSSVTRTISADSPHSSIFEDRSLPPTPESPQRNIKFENKPNFNISESDVSDADVPPVKPARKSSKTGTDLKAFVTTHSSNKPKDILSDIYRHRREIVADFQTFLEEELQKSPVLSQMYRDDDKMEKDVKEVLKRTKEELDKAYLEEGKGIVEELKTPSVMSEDEEPVGHGRERLESIVDIDPWFFQHIDAPTQDVPKEIVNEQMATNYDTKKLFPFGDILKRQDSLHDDFFDSKPGLKQSLQDKMADQ